MNVLYDAYLRKVKLKYKLPTLTEEDIINSKYEQLPNFVCTNSVVAGFLDTDDLVDKLNKLESAKSHRIPSTNSPFIVKVTDPDIFNTEPIVSMVLEGDDGGKEEIECCYSTRSKAKEVQQLKVMKVETNLQTGNTSSPQPLQIQLPETDQECSDDVRDY